MGDERTKGHLRRCLETESNTVAMGVLKAYVTGPWLNGFAAEKAGSKRDMPYTRGRNLGGALLRSWGRTARITALASTPAASTTLTTTPTSTTASPTIALRVTSTSGTAVPAGTGGTTSAATPLTGTTTVAEGLALAGLEDLDQRLGAVLLGPRLNVVRKTSHGRITVIQGLEVNHLVHCAPFLNLDDVGLVLLGKEIATLFLRCCIHNKQADNICRRCLGPPTWPGWGVPGLVI